MKFYRSFFIQKHEVLLKKLNLILFKPTTYWLIIKMMMIIWTFALSILKFYMYSQLCF